jgi:putative FmdB family regulatory protein
VPTYEYACTDCGDKSEVVQRFSDDPLTICTECGGRLRKVFSPVGIVFKGSGFYRNDSRNGSRSTSAAKDGAGKDSNGSKTDSSDGGGSSSESAKNGSSATDSSSSKTTSSSSSSSGSSGSSGGEKKSSVAASS